MTRQIAAILSLMILANSATAKPLALLVPFASGPACRVLEVERESLFKFEIPENPWNTTPGALWIERRPRFDAVNHAVGASHWRALVSGRIISLVSHRSDLGRARVEFGGAVANRDWSWAKTPFDRTTYDARFIDVPADAKAKVRSALRTIGDEGYLEKGLWLSDRAEAVASRGPRDYFLIGGDGCEGCGRFRAEIFEIRPDLTLGPPLCLAVWRETRR